MSQNYNSLCFKVYYHEEVFLCRIYTNTIQITDKVSNTIHLTLIKYTNIYTIFRQ